MRFKCLNQTCGRIVDVGPGQLAPRFCTACGSSLAHEGDRALNLQQTAETVGESGTSVFRRLTEITGRTFEQTTATTRKPQSINTGILSRLPVTGPPAAEPEDIPLFRVVAAPPGLLHDDEIPARQESSLAPAKVDSQNAQPELIPEDSLSIVVEGGQVTPEDKPDDFFNNLAELAIEHEETSPGAKAGLDNKAADLYVVGDRLFAMLAAQLPENIVRAGGGAEMGSLFPGFQAETSSPLPAATVEEESNPPVAETLDFTPDSTAEGSDGEDAEQMRMLKEDPLIENPESTSGPSGSGKTNENEFVNAAALLGKFENGAAVSGNEFPQVWVESFRYVLRGSGTHLLLFSVVIWLVTVAVLMKVGPDAAAPIMLLQLVLVACTGFTSILLGSTGQKAALRWPATTKEGWMALVRSLLRFAPMDILIAGLALISGYLAKGFVLLSPILMVTSSIIICLDSNWKNVFSPKRHLKMLAASPMAMIEMLVLGCGLGMLVPVTIGMIVSIFTKGAMEFWMLRLAFWFCLSGPIGWVAGTGAGYGIGLLYAASADQFDESDSPKGYEIAIAAGLLGVCLLLSFLF